MQDWVILALQDVDDGIGADDGGGSGGAGDAGVRPHLSV